MTAYFYELISFQDRAPKEICRWGRHYGVPTPSQTIQLPSELGNPFYRSEDQRVNFLSRLPITIFLPSAMPLSCVPVYCEMIRFYWNLSLVFMYQVIFISHLFPQHFPSLHQPIAQRTALEAMSLLSNIVNASYGNSVDLRLFHFPIESLTNKDGNEWNKFWGLFVQSTLERFTSSFCHFFGIKFDLPIWLSECHLVVFLFFKLWSNSFKFILLSLLNLKVSVKLFVS